MPDQIRPEQPGTLILPKPSSRPGPNPFQIGFQGFKILVADFQKVEAAPVLVHPNGLGGVVTGYAYDTIANQPIAAGQTSTPEPGTLGLLALGSLGLGFWRRKTRASEVGRQDEPA